MKVKNMVTIVRLVTCFILTLLVNVLVFLLIPFIAFLPTGLIAYGLVWLLMEKIDPVLATWWSNIDVDEVTTR